MPDAHRSAPADVARTLPRGRSAAPAGSAAGEDLAERAAAVRRDAVEHLSLLSGAASMCALARSGRSLPAAKYHEGRQAAAAQVLRAVRRGVAAVPALTSEQQAWARTHADAQGKSTDWLAYATGGLDALAELAEPQPKRPEM